MFIIRYRKIWYALSIVLVGLSFYGFLTYKFNLSIDFRGGAITEVRYDAERPAKEEVEQRISTLELGGFSVRPSGDTGYIVRTRELADEERTQLNAVFGISDSTFTIERQNSIGPVAGTELQKKAVQAILVVILMIVLFITFAFRGVSEPVSSWKYGFATVFSLFHDVVVPTGLFVFLGYLYGIEIDLLFVTGLLAILGYSVHDTIVVFDRVRENLHINQEKNISEQFDVTVGKSLTQTMGRSINTSVTLLITLSALYFLGSSATKEFSLLLLIGVIVGTYSSIFLASPLLVTFHKLQGNKVK